MRYKVTVRTTTSQTTYLAIGNLDKIIDAAFASADICAVTIMVQA